MIDNDTLTLYFYNDGLTNAQRREVELAMEQDASLAAAYSSLSEDLRQLENTSVVRAPEHLKHQWHDLIDQAANAEHSVAQPARSKWSTFLVTGLVAAGLFAAFVIGVQYTEHTADPGVYVAEERFVDDGADAAAFARGLQFHVQNAAWDLAELTHRSSTDRRELISEIVTQNRMFERAAESKNIPQVARLMRAIEPVLLRLAEQNISPQEADVLRLQLTFELNAVLTKIETSPSEVPNTI